MTLDLETVLPFIEPPARKAKPVEAETCKERDCLRPVYSEGRCKNHSDWYWYAHKARK